MNKRRSFIVGIKSTKLSVKEKSFLKKYKPWGVILFTRNIKNIDQTLKLTTSIRKLFKDKKYPILIDQEGGCLLYTSPSPRDISGSRMPSSA